MILSGVNLSVNSNVTIRCFEKQKLVQTRHCHNKATISMVQGILRFLKGDFTPSKYALNAIHDSGAAVQYIPSEIKFGNVGVQINRSGARPILNRETPVDYGAFVPPTFNAISLQEPFESQYLVNKTKFESADITSFDDTNNSMALLLQTFVPAKSLVGYQVGEIGEGSTYFQPYDWSYWNGSLKHGQGEWETMITELGLYSNNSLLARVVLDGKVNVDETGKITYEDLDYPNNPIFQSESSSIVIEWRIGIISIGPNDTFITEADINNEEEGE